MTDVIKIISLVIVFICVSIGSFFVYRYVHYKFAYKAMVEETVREMVKEEALKKPYGVE